MGDKVVPPKESEMAPVEEAHRTTGAGDMAKGGGRWSARRKREVVLRLLGGEDLESLSRELGVATACLSGWRDELLAGGEAVNITIPLPDKERRPFERGPAQGSKGLHL